MTDRDRLIELISKIQYMGGLESRLADHLLANGVIVPPCKVGDSIYRVGRGEIWEWQIAMAYIHPDETIYVDDSENEFTAEDIGKTVFLTKEEAEAKLKELKNNG